MSLKISSWIESGNQEFVPICSENFNFGYQFAELQNYDIVDSILKPCWDYIDKDYECFCLEPKVDNTLKSYIFNLFNFQFSFRERSKRRKKKKESNTFKIKKQHNLIQGFYYGCHYLSDVIGFSLLSLNDRGELKVFYYDFENKFSSNIKTQIPSFSCKDYDSMNIKLCSRSIWILTYISGLVSSIDVLRIKDEKIWYHVRNNGGYHYVGLDNVLSGVMLLVNDCRERFKFYDWKALYIDHDKLIPFKLSEANLIIEFWKPKELENENVDVVGTFKTTIVLIPKTDSNCLYFLIYDKRMQFKAFKKIDLSCFCNDGMRISLKPEVLLQGFTPEILKLLVPISTELIVIIDMEKVQVTQILVRKCGRNYYFTSPKYIRWSKEDKMLNLFYNLDFWCDGKYITRMNILKYVIFNRQSLKELALNTVVCFVTMEQIYASNLPQSLFREIMARKMI